jgi:YidC/Oxa1 family membrane protein insertase
MKLYKEHNVNPTAGCLPMIVQMPIWIGLYQALFALAPHMQTGTFFWITNLAAPEISSPAAIVAWPPAIPVLAVLTGVTQWIVQKMMTPRTTDPQQQATQAAMQFMPLMFVFFSLSVPAGLVLYWVTSNIFSMVQQYFITGWGSLAPKEKATASASAASLAETKREPALTSGPRALPSAKSFDKGLANGKGLSNGHSADVDALNDAIPQTTPTGKKRRRRAK